MGVVFWLALFLQAPGSCQSAVPEDVRIANQPQMPAAQRRQAFERLLRQCPAEPAMYAQYVTFLIGARDYAAALQWLDRGLRVAPADGGLRLKKAAVLRAVGDPEGSLATLAGLPPSAEASFQAGLDYRALGRHRAAQQSLADAWNRGFQDPYTLYSLIQEEQALGDKSEGMQHFQLFMARFPQSPWLHVLLGNAYLAQNRNDQARQEYLAALRADHALPSVHFLVGYLDYQGQQFGTAAEYFRQEIAVNPAFADASLFLGESLRQSGKIEEAIPPLRRAVTLDPRSALAYRTLGSVLAQADRLDEAAKVFAEGEKRFPADATFPAQLSRIYARLNRKEEAGREAERYRSLTAGGATR